MHLPAQLRNVVSILQPNQLPLLFGLGDGPSKSVTGILTYCQKYCGQMEISSKIAFIIDFDAIPFNGGSLVVGLDLQTMNFWINPIPPNSNVSQNIPANITINYQQQIGQYCDTIKIINAPNLQEINLIASCNNAYLQLTADLTTATLAFTQTFNKFMSCDPVDKTKPTFIAEGNLITLLIVECLQNRETVRTK
jgi:hypothetical protein